MNEKFSFNFPTKKIIDRTYHRYLSHNSSRWNPVHKCIDNHLPDRCKWRRAYKVSFRIHLYLVLGFSLSIVIFFVLNAMYDVQMTRQEKKWKEREKMLIKKIKYLCYIRRQLTLFTLLTGKAWSACTHVVGFILCGCANCRKTTFCINSSHGNGCTHRASSTMKSRHCGGFFRDI